MGKREGGWAGQDDAIGMNGVKSETRWGSAAKPGGLLASSRWPRQHQQHAAGRAALKPRHAARACSIAGTASGHCRHATTRMSVRWAPPPPLQ
jgi:hypothetical protein